MARNVSYYVKQNGKIIRSLLDNIDRLSKEIVDYAATIDPGEAVIWVAPSPQDMVETSAGPVKRILRKVDDDTIKIEIEFDFVTALQGSRALYEDLNCTARMEVAILLHSVLFNEPIIKKPQKV